MYSDKYVSSQRSSGAESRWPNSGDSHNIPMQRESGTSAGSRESDRSVSRSRSESRSRSRSKSRSRKHRHNSKSKKSKSSSSKSKSSSRKTRSSRSRSPSNDSGGRSRSRSRSRSKDGRSNKRSSASTKHRSSKKHRSSRNSRSRRRSGSRSVSGSRSRSSSRERSTEKPATVDPTGPINTSDKPVIRPPDQAFIQALLAKQTNTSADPQVTRQARRLYIGNLPIGLGLTEVQLTEFFSYASKHLGIKSEHSVLSTWVAPEGTFCFVEYRSVPDCTTALGLLQGLSFAGRPLRVGRPADYRPMPPPLDTYVVPVPPLAVAAASAAAQRFAGSPSHTNLIALSLTTAVAMQSEKKKDNADAFISNDLQTMVAFSNVPSLIQAAQAAQMATQYTASQLLNQHFAATKAIPGSAVASTSSSSQQIIPSRLPPRKPTVIAIENMMLATDVQDEDDHADLCLDAEDECAKYGKVLSVVIPRFGAAAGKVFVQFETHEQATAARAVLHGRMFSGRSVVCSLYNDEKFLAKEF